MRDSADAPLLSQPHDDEDVHMEVESFESFREWAWPDSDDAVEVEPSGDESDEANGDGSARPKTSVTDEASGSGRCGECEPCLLFHAYKNGEMTKDLTKIP